MAEQLDSDSSLDCSHLVAVAAIAQGDLDHLRAVLEDWHAGGQQLPLDLMRSGRIWGLAECAHAAGDTDAAQILYEQLAPYDGQLLVYAFQFICASAAFTLGLLAETLDQHDRAVGHYTDALALEESCGATALAARTRQALARVELVVRRVIGDGAAIIATARVARSNSENDHPKRRAPASAETYRLSALLLSREATP